VCRRIVGTFSSIPSGGDDAAIFDRHCSDRNLALLRRRPRLGQGQPHEAFVRFDAFLLASDRQPLCSLSKIARRILPSSKRLVKAQPAAGELSSALVLSEYL
jgi:hypothetical protein